MDIIKINDFLLSKCNEKAAEQCFKVASSHDEKGSLVYVCGPSPCGKTSLLHATSDIYYKEFGEEPIVVPFFQMLNDFVKSLNEKNKTDFFQKYSACRLLLVDDVQGIVGLSSTQEAFADVFVKLLDQGINIILFSDYKLVSFTELHTRLESRNINLIKVNMHKADFSLREKVLHSILNSENTSVSEKVFYYIVENKKIEVASFKGCVGKINLMRKLEQDKLDDKEIISVLKEYEG